MCAYVTMNGGQRRPEALDSGAVVTGACELPVCILGLELILCKCSWGSELLGSPQVPAPVVCEQ